MRTDKRVVERTIELFIEGCVKSDTARMEKEVYPEDVKVIGDISYDKEDSVFHKFDIYMPDAHMAKGLSEDKLYEKIVMDIHGGGFVYGLKEINKCCNMTIASRTSLPVVSINYTLSPRVSIVEQLNEICLAIKFLTEEYGVKSVTLMGDSAGGYLAAATWAIISDSKVRAEFHGRTAPQVKVDGLVLICPAARDDSKFVEGIEVAFFNDDEENLVPSYGRDLGEVVKRVNAPVPPSVLITSDKDFLEKETLYLADTMRELGGKVSVFDGVTADGGNELVHVYVVGHPEWAESQEPLELITRLIVE